MTFTITGVGDFDPHCCNRVCVVQLAAVPTADEFKKLQELTAEFFRELDDGHISPPNLFLTLDGQNLVFGQFAASRKTDRRVFEKLIYQKLGLTLKTQPAEVPPIQTKEEPKRAPRRSGSTSIPINQPAAA